MEKDLTRDAAQTQLPRWDGPLTHPFYSKVLKRGLDFALAVVFLFPCLVVMLPIAVAVKCTSRGRCSTGRCAAGITTGLFPS